MVRVFFIFSILLSATSFATTLNERLGYAPQDKLLIIHADDMGVSHEANRATYDVLNYGLVSSASVMAPTEEVEEVFQYNHEDFDLGVHLTLNSEWKNYRWGGVSPAGLIKSLLDRDGFMRESPLRTFFFARSGDLKREMEAQILKVLALGGRPSHIDSHMGSVFTKKKWIRSYLELAKKYQLAPFLIRWSSRLRKEITWAGYFHAKAIEKKARACGWLLLDTWISDPGGSLFEDRKEKFISEIKNLSPGVTQILVHPNYKGGRNFMSQKNHDIRDSDTRIFLDPDMKALFVQENIKIVSYAQIQRAYDWNSVCVPDL